MRKFVKRCKTEVSNSLWFSVVLWLAIVVGAFVAVRLLGLNIYG